MFDYLKKLFGVQQKKPVFEIDRSQLESQYAAGLDPKSIEGLEFLYMFLKDQQLLPEHNSYKIQTTSQILLQQTTEPEFETVNLTAYYKGRETFRIMYAKGVVAHDSSEGRKRVREPALDQVHFQFYQPTRKREAAFWNYFPWLLLDHESLSVREDLSKFVSAVEYQSSNFKPTDLQALLQECLEICRERQQFPVELFKDWEFRNLESLNSSYSGMGKRLASLNSSYHSPLSGSLEFIEFNGTIFLKVVRNTPKTDFFSQAILIDSWRFKVPVEWYLKEESQDCLARIHDAYFAYRDFVLSEKKSTGIELLNTH